MKQRRQKRTKKVVPWWMGLLAFSGALFLGAASKGLTPAWAKQYNVKWSDQIEKKQSDLRYGQGEFNTFDLYLPNDQTKDTYGLVVYLHGGGFTTGDKAMDESILAWLCSKGYVAAGINYTLRNEKNPEASVLSQSNEIREAMPFVIDAARDAGYPIDRMAIAGGSAGHTLAMLYAYRDGKSAPVPVVLTFGSVGPSSFYQEDWGIMGLDQSDEACALLFGVMSGTSISPDEIADRSYLNKVKPISAFMWIKDNPVPCVAAYGTHDRVQPYKASLRLKAALEENGVDHAYFEMKHSGHGLQNDNRQYRKWMETIEEYLERYMH